MKVTPDREAPIIPYATTNQGDFLLPLKKVSLLDFLEVIWAIKKSRAV